MTEPIVNYDEVGDRETGIELNSTSSVASTKKSGGQLGLTFFEYSLFAQVTEMGIRGFPPTGLAKLPDDLREMMLETLMQAPVRGILAMSAYTPSAETIPIMLPKSLLLDA